MDRDAESTLVISMNSINMELSVAHLARTDIVGGAARASYRLHKGLQRLGISSHMVVALKQSDDSYVHPPKGKIQRIWSHLHPRVDEFLLRFYPNRQESVVFSSNLIGCGNQGHDVVEEADIIHLHWIGRGYINLNRLPNCFGNKPIVWTLHDMWPFTGGCHYTGTCDRYQEGCGACPCLGSKFEKDLSWLIYQKKRKVFKNLNLTFVATTPWMADCACSSLLCRGKKIVIIPYGIDTEIFKPIEKRAARDILNLPQDKTIILFGALDATSDPRKGFSYLLESLNLLKKYSDDSEDRFCLVVFGASHGENSLPFEQHYVGYLHDDVLLALYYSAADVFVGPSLQEAFGQTFIESFSCGTPCVAFDYSGPNDIIDHKENGYLAQYKNPDDFARGIWWVIEAPDRYTELRANARAKAEQEYALEVQAQRYIRLYSQLLDRKPDE